MVQPAASAAAHTRARFHTGKFQADDPHHANRLVYHGHSLVVAAGEQGMASGALAFLGIPLEELGGNHPLANGFCHRFARFCHGYSGQIIGIGAHQVGYLPQEVAALPGIGGFPAGPCCFSGGYCCGCVGSAAKRYGFDGDLAARIDHRPSATADGILPLTTYIIFIHNVYCLKFSL
jgi:hypothetical protein